ncbi:MAG: 30S ribosomal protein S12 methylthiotransferase RimO, partial [Bacteroidetes bacterium]|nr:30S ribosomal protein S12 methylthiotransferase RimO [Bacteroidota bacterium]
MTKRVNIITLGCAKNLVDSEVFSGKLLKSSVECVFEQPFSKNDIVVVNTCGFILDAKQESIDMILSLCEAKKQGEIHDIIVAGCLSGRYPEDLKKEMTDVSYFFGTNQWDSIVELISSKVIHYLPGDRIISTPPHYAYLKISEGCDRNCSFCAIPMIRGKQVSQKMEDILTEAKALVLKGVKELIVIAQDTTRYGTDLYRSNKLPELLEELSKINPNGWIRLQYAYPTDFPDELARVIAKHPQICKYVDIPLQHISDRILCSMNRGVSRKQTFDLLQKLRKEIPGLAIRTAFITGYPDETKEEFEELVNFLSDQKFERVGVFTYSHEDGTPAYNLTDNIREKVKGQRAEKLIAHQSEISLAINESRIGEEMVVIIDEKLDDCYLARTEFDSPEVDNSVLLYTNRKIK